MAGRQECGKRARYATLLRFPDLDARAERRCRCEGVALHRLLATAEFVRERARRADGDGQVSDREVRGRAQCVEPSALCHLAKDLFQSSGFPELSFEEGASAPGMRSSKPSREARVVLQGLLVAADFVRERRGLSLFDMLLPTRSPLPASGCPFCA
ncbi:hypothetical protein DFH06DRAFT_1218134 [Mycena polygramma]|nr:hypothetical protein DFH06DRAFT_1218134 [Mycena polygramma]